MLYTPQKVWRMSRVVDVKGENSGVMAKGKSNRRCFFICNISENLGEQWSNRDHREPRFLS